MIHCMRRANQILGGPIYLGLLVQWFALCSPSVSEAEEPVLTRPGRVVTHYALTSAFTGEYPDPRDWLLLGSRDDGQSWEVLDTRTNQIFTERSQRKLFSLTNRTAYSTYRLVVTNTSCVQLAELELMGEMTGAGAEAELPLVASASREHPLLGPADDAFDGKPATRWLDFGAGQGACWLQCQYSARPELVVTNLSGYRVLARRLSARNPLGSRLAAIQSNLTVQAAAPAHKLKGYALTSANDFPGRDPKDWRLLGSNDGGKTWRTLDARRNQVFNGRLQRRSFLFPAPVEYSTYRLQVDSVRLPSGVNSVQLAEVEPLSDNKGHAFSIVVTAQGDNLPTETATAAFDEDATTKWLDFANNDAKARSSWIQWQYIPAEKWPVIDGRWLQALPAAPISTPNLRLDGVVVSWDPKTATLGFLDETEFQLFKLEPMPSSVRVGERARLSGHPEIGWEFPVVSEAELVRLGDLPLLPKETAGLSVGTGPAFFSGTIEGRVVSVSRDPPLADLTLRMGEGQTTVTARVLDSQRALPVFTPGARAQVRGVIQAIFDEQGRRIAGTLWAPGPDSVRLLGGEPPPEPAASARASDWSVPANSIREVYDRLAQSQGKQFSAQVRGVITYIDLGLGSFYLQAGTDGILVNGLLEAGLAPGLGQEGLYVELNGVVTTNQPVIEARGFVKVIGRGRMPEPRPATWDSLLSGKEEGRWVQAPGVVSSCEEHLLTLVVPGGRLVVWVNELDRSAHNRLLGSTVRVNGVCESVRDNRNRRLGVRLLTPSEACIDIVRAAPADPFSLRTRPLGAVIDMESAGSGASRGLIKTAGVVTHWERRLLFIQEGEAGLRVYPRDEEAVEPGDRVEVVGLLEPDGFSPKLARALVRKTGRSPLPRPTPINLLDPDLSDQDATRVTFEAVFLGGGP